MTLLPLSYIRSSPSEILPIYSRMNAQWEIARTWMLGGSIGALWHETGSNGDASDAHSCNSMVNGTTGDI